MTGKIARALAALYIVLLAASWAVRRADRAAPALPDGASAVELSTVDGERRLDRKVRVAYRDVPAAGGAETPALILLHGSPGSSRDFRSVVPGLAARYRLIVPDLPGFGASAHRVPDYSIRAHAVYVLELMDALGVADAHVVGFSMGGGVALSLADLAPERVRSITLLSSIGVQELELLGDYRLNRVLHGFQLLGLFALHELTPHFGWLDDAMLDVPYARNFLDTDQRPLRAILVRWRRPMLIVHGREDPLVPIEAAEEHARIVPQAELHVTHESHFMVFEKTDALARVVVPFLGRVDDGEAVTRASAHPARIAAASAPFDFASLPKFSGLPLAVVSLLIASSTLISEDLACIGAGLLVAAGRLGFGPATLASFAGIFVGDLLLFIAGRTLGRAVLARAPMKWFLTTARLDRSSAWFRERGPMVILASRFLPGTRFTTYVAAGVLHTPFWTFLLWFGVAALLWTPLLVGVSALIGAPILPVFEDVRYYILPAIVVVGAIVITASRVVPKLLSWRGRRLLRGSWRRLVRWEYWPPYVFYPPVVLYAAWLGIRHRGLTVFTAANPGIDAGGFVGESKAAILRGLAGAGETVPPWRLLPARDAVEDRMAAVRRFVEVCSLALPVVLKPDAGQRGSGVAIAKTWDEVDAYLCRAPYDVLVQAYVPGVEFGVFYVRRPPETHGRIFAITEKELPCVTGDGTRTLEHLILDDPRALPMARTYLEKQNAHLGRIVGDGERVQLVELGTHCRGAYFRDGMRLATPELSAEIDRVSRAFDGFFFGRYDVRSASIDDFRRGRFKVLELNGVTSEVTSIYDPARSALAAYRVLFEQWRLAYEIGAQNRARGADASGVLHLARLAAGYRSTAAAHVD